jgi:predicted nucleotidyltransferase
MRRHKTQILTYDSIVNTLKTVYNKYNNIRIGIAGSYANGTQTSRSDIDVVIDGDSKQAEVMFYIKDLFDIPVDVLWLDLLKEEDRELDAIAIKNELNPNKFSAYKTIIQEVKWI